jgi:hypothetical protein
MPSAKVSVTGIKTPLRLLVQALGVNTLLLPMGRGDESMKVCYASNFLPQQG